MDETHVDDVSADQRRPRLRFGPDRRVTGLAALGAAVAIVLAVTASDAAGRLIFGLAVLLLAGYAITDLVFAPRLSADASGLRVRSPLARATLGWDEVDDVRADVRTRHGLRSVTLEIDAGETLIVLSRRALGTAPEDVAAAVRAIRPQ